MRLRVDLHVHTRYSDGNGTVDEVLRAARGRGLDAIAVTDHGTTGGYLKARARARGLTIIPGLEVRTDAGHVLVLGIEEPVGTGGPVRYEDLIGEVRDRGGLAILAHPALGRPRMGRWARCRPDAVEALNALYPLFGWQVGRGISIASALGLPGVGGSDAHLPSSVGDAYTVVEADGAGPWHVLEAIRAGHSRPGGGPSPIAVRLRVGLGYVGFLIRHKLSRLQTRRRV